MFVRLFIAATLMLGASAGALAQLPEAMAKVLREANIPEDAVGVMILRGNTVLLAHNAERSMLPASTMKVVTSMVALDQLGPIFRGRTELRTNAELSAAGVLNGDLVLRGGADADFNEDVLTHMLQNLRSQGIQTIRGDLIVDRQLFQPARPDLAGAPFDQTPEFRYNVVPDAALLNTNMLRIDFMANDKRLKLTMLPALEGVTVSSDMTLINGSCAAWESGWRPPESVRADNGKLQVILHGTFPRNCNAATSINVLDRKDYIDRLFRAIWRSLGGSFNGEAREATSITAGGQAEAGTRLLTDHVARALPEVLRDMNKTSDNTLARLVYLSIGGLEMDPMFGSHPAPVSTTETTAQRSELLIRLWFATHRIGDEGLVLDNGSGLSRWERIRPSQMAAVLQAASLSPWAPEFMASLPIAGLDGTMRRRLRGSPAASRARIKTGTLNNVVAIAGFVPDASGQLCVVVGFINQDLVGTVSAGRAALDALIDWVATSAPAGM